MKMGLLVKLFIEDKDRKQISVVIESHNEGTPSSTKKKILDVIVPLENNEGNVSDIDEFSHDDLKLEMRDEKKSTKNRTDNDTEKKTSVGVEIRKSSENIDVGVKINKEESKDIIPTSELVVGNENKKSLVSDGNENVVKKEAASCTSYVDVGTQTDAINENVVKKEAASCTPYIDAGTQTDAINENVAKKAAASCTFYIDSQTDAISRPRNDVNSDSNDGINAGDIEILLKEVELALDSTSTTQSSTKNDAVTTNESITRDERNTTPIIEPEVDTVPTTTNVEHNHAITSEEPDLMILFSEPPVTITISDDEEIIEPDKKKRVSEDEQRIPETKRPKVSFKRSNWKNVKTHRKETVNNGDMFRKQSHADVLTQKVFRNIKRKKGRRKNSFLPPLLPCAQPPNLQSNYYGWNPSYNSPMSPMNRQGRHW